VVKKRTALGRLAHESAAFGKPVVGKPLAVYMGDDARNEYIYKFVSTQNWLAADAAAADRVATGDKYLDAGKLYAARFNADGTGQWIELSMANPTVAGYAGYTFADDGDVVINARLAGDAVGATKMDRPEWCGTHPTTGEVYFTLTNNSNRRLGAVTGSQLNPDAANPRAYTDIRGASTVQSGNPNGHIVRIKEDANEPGATTFTWDIYLFGAEAGAPGIINLSGLGDDNDFSSPDGIVFTPSTGLCWVQTDDGAYTDVTNCMMLAAVPGTVGDGAAQTIDYGGGSTVATRVGAKPTAATLKRFLVGPIEQEITGLCESPDGKVLFVNVQHPGEDTLAADIGDPSKYTSHWPGNAGYGAGGATARPRSATVMVTKNDGGRVGT
jgi:secreted PhoX family phosphatase